MEDLNMSEGQSNWKQNFFDKAESIVLTDPLAWTLGATEKDGQIVFKYADAVKLAGHSCAAVSGAYKITAKALKALYGKDTPVRGNIKVTIKGGATDLAYGPMSQVISFITGAPMSFLILPPSTMSVPRPAMFVAMVIMPARPAWATMSASRACCLALSTWCGRLALFRSWSMISEFSIEVVPTSTGWPRSWHSRMSRIAASYFSRVVLYTRSSWSSRLLGRLGGITTVSRP